MMPYEDPAYYVGWGTLGLINANLAQLRGRSGLWWFVGSMVGGPLITLLLLFTERRAG